MSREQITLPPLDMQPTRDALDRALNQIVEIRQKIAQRLEVQYNRVNQNVLLDGGGFFCKRDNAAVEAVYQAMRDAFFAGFKRSDMPPPPEERIEAAFREWMQRS
jgi:hypothetical protein